MAGEAWQQQVDALVSELQAAMTQDALSAFFQGWDLAGGGPCRSMRERVCSLLQEPPVPWQKVHFAAEALQELCWEHLHTGHWADVAVEWRDAYCLYTLLSVVSTVAAAHMQPSNSTQQHSMLAAGGQQVQQQGSSQHQHQQHLAISQLQGAPQPGQAGSSGAARAPPASAAPAVPAQSSQQVLTEALRQLDLAALMGGLRFRPWVDRLIDVFDARLQHLQGNNNSSNDSNNNSTQLGPAAGTKRQPDEGNTCAGPAPAPGTGEAANSVAGSQHQPLQAGAAGASRIAAAADPHLLPPNKLPRLTGTQDLDTPPAAAAGVVGSSMEPDHPAEGGVGSAAAQPTAAQQQQARPLPPGSLTAASMSVPVEHAPSMEHFMLNYMLAEGGGRPCVLRGVMEAWPALTKWQDLDYLCKVAGRRTVPVEVGSHYLAEGWGTQLMTLADFIAAMMTRADSTDSNQAQAAAQPVQPGQPRPQQQQPAQQPLLYLAQHQLFEQIPALAADILTPDYCMLGEKGVSAVNAWFGPGGTVTPLHQDPEHNLLAQVVGRKYVRLYDPRETASLYPHESGMHTNTSRVDLHSADVEQLYPGFCAVPYIDVVLQPGDMLYMPPKWWHFVQSMSTSFSVSFWWS